MLGVGNLLLTDDGVGVHAVRAFARIAPPGVLALDAGTAMLQVESLVESAGKLLVFDALCSGQPPGTVAVARLAEIQQRPVGDSLHNVTLKAFRHPPDALVVGAEPELVDIGLDLTPRVEAAVSRMISAASAIIECWRGGRPADLEAICGGVSTHVSCYTR